MVFTFFNQSVVPVDPYHPVIMQEKKDKNLTVKFSLALY